MYFTVKTSPAHNDKQSASTACTQKKDTSYLAGISVSHSPIKSLKTYLAPASSEHRFDQV